MNVQQMDLVAASQAIDQLTGGAQDFRDMAGNLRRLDANGWSGAAHDLYRAQVNRNAGHLEVTAAIRDSAAALLSRQLEAWGTFKFAWVEAVNKYGSAVLCTSRSGVRVNVSAASIGTPVNGGGTISTSVSGRRTITKLHVDPWRTKEGIRFEQTHALSQTQKSLYSGMIVVTVAKAVRTEFETAEKAAYGRLVAAIDAAAAIYNLAGSDVATGLDQLTATIPTNVAAAAIAAGGAPDDSTTYANALALQQLKALGPTKAAKSKAVTDRLNDPLFQQMLANSLSPEGAARFYAALPSHSDVRTRVLEAVDRFSSPEDVKLFAAKVPLADIGEYMADVDAGKTLPLGSPGGLGVELAARWIEYELDPTSEKIPKADLARLGVAEQALVNIAINDGYSPFDYGQQVPGAQPPKTWPDGVSPGGNIVAKLAITDPSFASRLLIRLPVLAEPTERRAYGNPGMGAAKLQILTPELAGLIVTTAMKDPERRDAVRGAYLDVLAGVKTFDDDSGWNATRAKIYLTMIDTPEDWANGQPPNSLIGSGGYPTHLLGDLTKDPVSAQALITFFGPLVGLYAVNDFERARALAEGSGDPEIDKNTFEEYSPYTAFLRDLWYQHGLAIADGTSKNVQALKPDDWGDFLQDVAIGFGISVGVAVMTLTGTAPVIVVTLAGAGGEALISGGLDAIALSESHLTFKDNGSSIEIKMDEALWRNARLEKLIAAYVGEKYSDEYGNAITSRTPDGT